MMENTGKKRIKTSTIIGLSILAAFVVLVVFVIVKNKANNAALKREVEEKLASTRATEVPQGFVYCEGSVTPLAENCSAWVSAERRDTSNDDLLFISYNFNGASSSDEEECFAAFLIMLMRYFATTQFEYISVNGKLSDGSFCAVEFSDWNKIKDASGGNRAFLQKAIDIYNGFEKSLAEQRARAVEHADALFNAINWNGEKTLVKLLPNRADNLPYLLLGY